MAKLGDFYKLPKVKAAFSAMVTHASEAKEGSEKLEYLTIIKNNIDDPKILDLLKKSYDEHYMKWFTNPDEREPFERWVEDIKLGTNAPNVRLVTIFGKGLLNNDENKLNIMGIAASELYKVGEKEITFFANYYFKGFKEEKSKSKSGDTRENTNPSITMMLTAQFKEAEELGFTKKMKGKITSAFFEAESPEKILNVVKAQDIKIQNYLQRSKLVSGNNVENTKVTEFINNLADIYSKGFDEKSYNKALNEKISKFINENNIAPESQKDFDKLVKGIRRSFKTTAIEIPSSYDFVKQIIPRDNMYNMFLRGVEHIKDNNYVQPPLEEGAKPCKILTGRFIGLAKEYMAFYNKFCNTFAEKNPEEFKDSDMQAATIKRARLVEEEKTSPQKDDSYISVIGNKVASIMLRTQNMFTPSTLKQNFFDVASDMFNQIKNISKNRREVRKATTGAAEVGSEAMNYASRL
jgi:hypothetical protein